MDSDQEEYNPIETYSEHNDDNIQNGKASVTDDDGDISIRNDLTTTTFEDILRMRDKLGTKIYRDSVLKKLADSDTSSEINKKGKEFIQSKNGQKQKNSKLNPNLTQFRRINRSFPIEASSKRIDYRHNFATIPLSANSNDNSNSFKKIEFRDPRFESKVGEFKSEKFNQNYVFLQEMKQKELEDLKRNLKKAKTEATRTNIQSAIQVLQNQLRNDYKREQAKIKQREIKDKISKFKELSIVKDQDSISETNRKIEKPKGNQIFVNKATMKRAQLAEKFKELKRSGKLEKYLEKKRKKNVTKDRRLLNSSI